MNVSKAIDDLMVGWDFDGDELPSFAKVTKVETKKAEKLADFVPVPLISEESPICLSSYRKFKKIVDAIEEAYLPKFLELGEKLSFARRAVG